jgi:hypothetical protein
MKVTKLAYNDKFSYKGSTKVYCVSKVYHDGAILAKDNEGDEYSFEVAEFSELVKVKSK